MPTVLITGAAGLVGSEAVRYYAERGWTVWGIDNDQRSKLFGTTSIEGKKILLAERAIVPQWTFFQDDIRDAVAMDGIVKAAKPDLVIHTAAQPSHDWSAKDPLTDFAINATGTLNVLEATRKHAPGAVFCFTSTNKVYGDPPWVFLNELPTRWEPDANWPGFNESQTIDQTVHSPFGVSKAAADLMVQEYGRYFGLRTGVFRLGCITGPAHAGAELHGFLAYLVECCVSGKPYTVFGHKAKQVRDNIHAYDLVTAFDEFYKKPRAGAVYNLGGGRERSISVMEAILWVESLTKKRLNWSYNETARKGDHQFWVTDCSKFRSDYPAWEYKYGLEDMIREIVEAKKEAA